MLFEFERQACVEIYSMLIAAGLELSQSGHIRFTELCQCTRSHQKDCGAEIASIDLEIQTFPARLIRRGLNMEQPDRLARQTAINQPRPVHNGAARPL